MQLRAAHRDAETADEIEGVVAGEAGEVEILGEDKRREDAKRRNHGAARQMMAGFDPHMRGRGARKMMRPPLADTIKNEDSRDGGEGEPCDSTLTPRQHDEHSQQRPDGASSVAAHLKE